MLQRFFKSKSFKLATNLRGIAHVQSCWKHSIDKDFVAVFLVRTKVTKNAQRCRDLCQTIFAQQYH